MRETGSLLELVQERLEFLLFRLFFDELLALLLRFVVFVFELVHVLMQVVLEN